MPSPPLFPRGGSDRIGEPEPEPEPEQSAWDEEDPSLELDLSPVASPEAPDLQQSMEMVREALLRALADSDYDSTSEYSASDDEAQGGDGSQLSPVARRALSAALRDRGVESVADFVHGGEARRQSPQRAGNPSLRSVTLDSRAAGLELGDSDGFRGSPSRPAAAASARYSTAIRHVREEAERAGLRVTDLIVRVDGVDMAYTAREEVVARIESSSDRPLELTVFTTGSRRSAASSPPQHKKRRQQPAEYARSEPPVGLQSAARATSPAAEEGLLAQALQSVAQPAGEPSPRERQLQREIAGLQDRAVLAVIDRWCDRRLAAAFGAWRRQREETLRLVLATERVLKHLPHWGNSQARAMVAWKRGVVEERKLRHAARRSAAAERVLHRLGGASALASAVYRWGVFVEQSRRGRAVALHVLSHMSHYAQARALEGWRMRVAEQRRLEGLASRAVRRLQQSSLASALGAWVLFTAQQRRRQNLRRRAVERLMSSHITAAFEAWRWSTMDSSRLNLAAEKVALRMQSSLLALAWGK